MGKTVINWRWVFFCCIFGVLIVLGVLMLPEDLGLSIVAILIGVGLILGYTLLIPNRYTFSEDGITVRYGFGLKTFLQWKDIVHLEDHYAGITLFPRWREYEIGFFESKILFHQEATLPKNKKTTAYIQKYYHKKIDKYG